MRLKRGQRILSIPGHAEKEVYVERRTIAVSETSQGFRLAVGKKRDFTLRCGPDLTHRDFGGETMG
jgi:hypothetical protein